ncbi:MAG: DEAD/DEAH box helicase [Candidatus Diapherotrites archaeon]
MSFEDIEVSSEIKEAIKKMNYDKATEVQSDTIPLILKGHNVIVKSQTGSGKTAAFGIPISEQIFTGKKKSTLILCPTRELAVQVKDELRKINNKTRLNIFAFYGGHGITSELRDIDKGVDILCATPGRLLDHFRNNNLDPKQFDSVVLDEADRMLDMGFINDIKEILNQVKPNNTHLFSATLDGSVAHLIKEYIPTYEEIILADELIGKNIFERHIKVPREHKTDALLEVIDEAEDGRVLVFVSTKRSADFLSRKLYKMRYNVESIHGDKSQKAREIALEKFRSGRAKILIGTDVAARGLQIDNVEYVVNYDLAQDEDTHKHRIGRTGRMGETGHAITFVGEDGSIIAPPKMYNKKGGRGGGGFRSNNSGRSQGSSYGRSGVSGRSSGGYSGGRSGGRSGGYSGGRSGSARSTGSRSSSGGRSGQSRGGSSGRSSNSSGNRGYNRSRN